MSCSSHSGLTKAPPHPENKSRLRNFGATF